MNTMERRFNSEYGERYLKNGRRRCQASSKTQIAYIRGELEDNPNPNPEPDFKVETFEDWERVQCSKVAVEGTFQCDKHGGLSLTVPRRDIGDYLPVDLRQKTEVMERNPDYLSNQKDIAILNAFTADLFESLEGMPISAKAYEIVESGLRQIEDGDIQAGCSTIREAIKDERNKAQVRAEYKENVALLDKLRRSQFQMMKELKLMATIDQIKNLMARIYNEITMIIKEEVTDLNVQFRIFSRIGELFGNATGTSTATVGAAVHEVSSEDERVSV